MRGIDSVRKPEKGGTQTVNHRENVAKFRVACRRNDTPGTGSPSETRTRGVWPRLANTQFLFDPIASIPCERPKRLGPPHPTSAWPGPSGGSLFTSLAAVTKESRPMSHLTVLIVEDNRDDLDLLLRMLARHPHAHPVVATDGVEALDYLLDEMNQLPALVVLDLNLPKLSGLAVLRRLRTEKRTRSLPVIVFTATQEERELIEAYQEGAQVCVRKPLQPTTFEESLQQFRIGWVPASFEHCRQATA